MRLLDPRKGNPLGLLESAILAQQAAAPRHQVAPMRGAAPTGLSPTAPPRWQPGPTAGQQMMQGIGAGIQMGQFAQQQRVREEAAARQAEQLKIQQAQAARQEQAHRAAMDQVARKLAMEEGARGLLFGGMGETQEPAGEDYMQSDIKVPGLLDDPRLAGSREALAAVGLTDPQKGAEMAAGLLGPGYKERERPLAGGMIQREASRDNGQTWEPIGPPTPPTYDPVAVQDPTNPLQTRLIPKHLIGQKLTTEQITQYPLGPAKSGLRITKDGDDWIIEQGPGVGGVSKGTLTSLEKEAVTNTQALDRIEYIGALYEPEFLTYKGAAKGKWATFLNKMDPDKRSKFQTRRSRFISAINRDFLTFRKWATGVAGGEKEMAEIKRATFSEDDSPQDFESKIDLARSLYRRLNARTLAAKKAGVDPRKNNAAFQQYLKAYPLESIPTLQQRGDQLEKEGMKKAEVLEILIQEGYIRR